MMKWLSLAALLLCLTGCITSEPANKDVIDLTTTAILANGETHLTYRVFTPSKTDGKCPVCIYLHDDSGIGTNNVDQLDDGANAIVRYVKNEAISAYVIIPQCPPGKQWKDEDILILLDELIITYVGRSNTDEKRVYLTGFGMGGEGAWMYALTFPDRISTVVPVCGGALAMRSTADPDVPIELADVNIWAIHYLDDRVRTADLSKKIISGIWTQNVGLAKMTEFISGGHTADIYKNDKFMGWLFATRRATEESENKGGAVE